MMSGTQKRGAKGTSRSGSADRKQKGDTMGKGLGGQIVRKVAKEVEAFRGLVAGWKNKKAIKEAVEKDEEVLRLTGQPEKIAERKAFLEGKGPANWTEEETKEWKGVQAVLKTAEGIYEQKHATSVPTAGITKTTLAGVVALSVGAGGYLAGKSGAGVQVMESGIGKTQLRADGGKVLAVEIAQEEANCIDVGRAQGKSINDAVAGCREVFDASHGKRAEFAQSILDVAKQGPNENMVVAAGGIAKDAKDSVIAIFASGGPGHTTQSPAKEVERER